MAASKTNPKRNRKRAKSIQPLDGGFDNYIATLDEIRRHVQSHSSLTKDALKRWYSKRYGPTREIKAGHSFDTTTAAYIDSLFRCGLLEQEGGSIGCRELPTREQEKHKKIVQVIDGRVVFILEMLEATREWTTEDDLLQIANEEHRLSLTVQQIRYRRGWLQSAGMVEAPLAKDKRFRATPAGRRLLGDEPKAQLSPTVNAAEFSGGGEGEEHRKLKEHVHEHCEEILNARVDTREVEYELPSGDRVDVTAANQSTVWHIEVKSRISNDNDIRRGIYQCVKYRAVAKAAERIQRPNAPRKAVSLLVVGRKLDPNLKKEAKALRARHLVLR